ncbi:MAG: hypothetical protein GY710_20585 [Desulfobacteraceae bacterium]|nr:hypothetical protein [Desulfobacteraceae bacterium]
MLQSQKLESIGTLAGGIAHDFNNILTGIFGFSMMVKQHLNEPEKAKKDVDQIIKCAQKAANLVKHILAFSRKSDHKKQPLRLSSIIKEVATLLRSSIPTSIEIQVAITTESNIMADPIQIQQVIMNLSTNAYHAMEKTGGVLTINLDKIQFKKPNTLPELNMLSGNYLKLEIIDTGSGMDSKTTNKIFDPYFTTKEPDKGTGLGLSVVHGIVTKHDGHIKVRSKPGQGSVFTVFFPITEKVSRLII